MKYLANIQGHPLKRHVPVHHTTTLLFAFVHKRDVHSRFCGQKLEPFVPCNHVLVLSRLEGGCHHLSAEKTLKITQKTAFCPLQAVCKIYQLQHAPIGTDIFHSQQAELACSFPNHSTTAFTKTDSNGWDLGG